MLLDEEIHPSEILLKQNHEDKQHLRSRLRNLLEPTDIEHHYLWLIVGVSSCYPKKVNQPAWSRTED
jgi:hypothetical protein